MAEYPYARGDLMGTPNTYFYTAFEGHAFLRAWWSVREAALEALPDPASQAPVHNPDAGGAGKLLESAYLEACELASDAQLPFHVEMLLKKFEVSKRIYDAYDSDLRPMDRWAFRTPGNYLRLGEVFDEAFENSNDLRALNALLKCLDTLIAHLSEVGEDMRPRVARLIARERVFVSRLAEGKGVPLA